MKIIYKHGITDEDRKTEGIRCISLVAVNESFGAIGNLQSIPQSLHKAKHKNRIAQVLWSKPAKLPFLDARWGVSNQFELTLPLAALSVAMLKELGQEVVLYTDTDGQKLLGDLGYDRIYNILDKLAVRNDFWACGKILALQNEPLDSLQIDTDIFVYDGALLDKAFELEIVGSHVETTTSYQEILLMGQKHFEYLQGDSDYSINMGLFKVANLYKKQRFITNYWAGLKKFSDPKLLAQFKEKGHGAYCIDLLIEQFNFYKLCTPDALIELPALHAEAIGFVHLLSFEKYLKIPFVLDILMERYPETYNIVIKKWEELDFSVWLEDKKFKAI